jgi:hypothetical protein
MRSIDAGLAIQGLRSMTAFDPLRSLVGGVMTFVMTGSNTVRLALLVACASASCAQKAPPANSRSENVWQIKYWGNDEAFAALQQAASACRYNDVREVLGQLLEPYLHIVIPEHINAEYECLRQWLKDHKHLGFRVPPRSKGK